MPIAIEPLAHHQLPLAAQALSNAFQDDPLYNFVVPNPDHRRRWLPVIKKEVLRNTLPAGHTYIAIDDQRAITAVMALTPPGKFPHPWWTNLRLFWNVLLWPTPWCPTVSKVWPLRRYAATFDEIHYRQPHWYIDVIGVDARWQGQGIGTLLMRRVIESSEESQHPIWLETQTESNVGYYEAFGFRVTVKKHPAPGGPPTWGLLRPV